MANASMNINHALISGISGKIKAKLGTGSVKEYQGIINKLSVSKGSYRDALKAELLKEGQMTDEIQELLKEIAGLIENASAGFQALDKKWSKSQISK